MVNNNYPSSNPNVGNKEIKEKFPHWQQSVSLIPITCRKCLKGGHIEADCKNRCFYCEKSHNSALCDNRREFKQAVYDASAHIWCILFRFRIMRKVITADIKKGIFANRITSRRQELHQISLVEGINKGVRKNLYVDNVLISAEDKEENLEKYFELKTIFEEASMNIR
ncbi:unnamed protein product [Dracunculus medinensis]|uniref:CCHC-type domain-containing protein n=1 Tax=Dracunculus medinensis TaxID=318479 RepID=A0A158Q6B3_DRAME|nr:unnamed protein product [Dracunculus medinensis]